MEIEVRLWLLNPKDLFRLQTLMRIRRDISNEAIEQQLPQREEPTN